MKVLIGTKNPGKIQGAKEAFKNYFDTFASDAQKRLCIVLFKERIVRSVVLYSCH